MLLSACMIVRNEAAVLPRALASLRGRVGEIVVVDTGSSDGTQALCRDAGCVLVEERWQQSFSAARNAALRLARGRYCLMIDADEEVDGATWPSLLSFLEEERHPLGRIWQVSETAGGQVREAITRLCPNDGRYRYEGRVHEQLVGPGTRGDTGLILWHNGYTQDAIQRKNTAARNLELLRRDLAERPGDPYLLYQIGRTLFQDRPAEAAQVFQQALCAVPPDAPYLASLVRELGYALRAAEAQREALALVRAFSPRLPRFTDLVFLEGLLHMDLGDAAAMVSAFSRCLDLGEAPPDFPSSVAGVGTFRPHHNLGLFFELCGDAARARHHYMEALRAHPGYPPTLARLRGLDSPAPRPGP